MKQDVTRNEKENSVSYGNILPRREDLEDAVERLACQPPQSLTAGQPTLKYFACHCLSLEKQLPSRTDQLRQSVKKDNLVRFDVPISK